VHYAHPQQTGMLFIMTQQVQPACIIAVMQSQHDWMIWQHFGSPELQLILQPLSVISQLVIPIVRLQQQTIMPFIIMQQLTMEPVSIEQRFFIMLAAMASSQTHVIVMPVLVRSIFMVQRGTIIMLGTMPPVEPPIVPMPVLMPGIAMPARSIITMVMLTLLNEGIRIGMDRAGTRPWKTRHPWPAASAAAVQFYPAFPDASRAKKKKNANRPISCFPLPGERVTRPLDKFTASRPAY
jgi:hypothetical protein